MRKAQITYFVILGILIVILVSAAFYISKSKILLKTTETLTLEEAVEKLGSEIDQCLDSVLEEGIYVSALHGGYTFTPSNYFDFEDIDIPYYFFENKKTVISEEQLKSELEFYIINNLPDCIPFNYYRGRGITISLEATDPVITLKDSSVGVSLDYPISISKDDSEYKLDRTYKVEKSSRIKLLRDISEEIIKRFMTGKYLIDFEYTLAQDVNITNTFYPNTLVYSLIDGKFSENPERPLVYNFAIQNE